MRTGRYLKGRTQRQSTELSFLQLAAGMARWGDRILTALLSILLLVILAYASFALWDTWRIYDSAGIDEDLLRYKPQLNLVEEGDGFAELLQINPEVCAWLTVEDTHIDYPVVQGEDNAKYVNTDVYGEFSLSGSIFLDYRNAGDFTDSYSLLYGHHMEGGVMFGELAQFLKQDYFDEHPTGTLLLPNRACRIEIFACLQTDAYDTQVFYPGNLSEGELNQFLERIKEDSAQYREIGVSSQDRVIALSTCSDTSTNARTVVFGRLIEISNMEGGAMGE